MDAFPLNLSERLSRRFTSSVRSSTEIDDDRLHQLRASIVRAMAPTARVRTGIVGKAQTAEVKESDAVVDQFLGLPLEGTLCFSPSKNEYLILQAELARQGLALAKYPKATEFELVPRESWIRELRKKRAKAQRARKHESSASSDGEEQPKKKKKTTKSADKQEESKEEENKKADDPEHDAKRLKKVLQERERRAKKKAAAVAAAAPSAL